MTVFEILLPLNQLSLFQELEIKKAAKAGDKTGATILAKQLIQIRKQKTRTYAAQGKVRKKISNKG